MQAKCNEQARKCCEVGRLTISNLSREMGVSRPLIYRAMERLGIERRGAEELSEADWLKLKAEVSKASERNNRKRADVRSLNAAEKKAAAKLIAESESAYAETESSGPDTYKLESTLKNRLICARQEYEYNRSLIVQFQTEIDAYKQLNNKTTMMGNNSVETIIPPILNLEKYTKVNITLSRLISDIESDLDLTADGGANPFV